MARISFPVVVVALVLANNIPGGFASGAGCVNKSWSSAEECIEKCSSRFGWLGHIMGSDPWGMVVRPASDVEDPQTAVETACKAKFGTASTASTSIAATTTPIVNAQSTPSASATSASSATETSFNLSPSGFSTSTIIRSSSSVSVSSSSVIASPSSFFPSSSTAHEIPTVTSELFKPTVTANTAIVKGPEHLTSSASSDATTSATHTTTSQPPPPPKTTSEAQQTTQAPPPPPKSTTKAAPPPKTTADNGNGNNGGNSGNNGNNSGNNGNNGSSGGTVSAADQQAYLEAHNTVRAKHGASPLVWANDLEAAAQKWANNCVFKHSGGTLGPFGENLAAGTGSSYTIATAVNSWAVEVSQYNPNDPQASHFTQMVWKASTEVGCAFTSCSGIFSASFGQAAFHVCEYRVQGNVIGEFGENVQV